MRTFCSPHETRDTAALTTTITSGAGALGNETAAALGTLGEAGYRAEKTGAGAAAARATFVYAHGSVPQTTNGNETGAAVGNFAAGASDKMQWVFYVQIATKPINGTINLVRWGSGTSSGIGATTALPQRFGLFTNTTSDATQVVCTTTSLEDPSETFTSATAVGSIIECGGKTMTITSITGTTIVNGAGWSGGGQPSDGLTWTQWGFMWNQVTMMAPTVGTTYRVEVTFDFGASTYTTLCKVYAEQGTTVLGTHNTSGTSNPGASPNVIEFGIATSVTITDPFKVYISELMCNNMVSPNLGGTSQNGNPVAGSSYREQNFSAGTHQEWSTAAATHLAAIEQSATYLAKDDADFIYSTNAIPMRDTYALPAYAGGNDLRCVLVVTRTTTDNGSGSLGTAGNEVFHRAGLFDGTNHIDGTALATVSPSTAFRYNLCIIQDQYNSANAITASWYASAEASIRRVTDNGGANFMECSYILLQVQDSDGVTLPVASTFVPRVLVF